MTLTQNQKNCIVHQGLYTRDVFTVKRYGAHIHRIVYQPCKRVSGLEDEKRSAKCSVNDHKLANNLSRSRSKIFELLMCNPFDYFCTFTISPEKFDRYKLHDFIKAFSRFLQNYNRFCTDDEKVRYVLVPEMHKDGAWHFHGVIKGIKGKDLLINKYGYLTWKQYNDNFGFISMSKIESKEKLSSYMQKYITKDLCRTVTELGAHSYYSSKGLKTADVEFQGSAQLINGYEWDFEHPDGYCKILTIDDRFVSLDEVIRVLDDTKQSF